MYIFFRPHKGKTALEMAKLNPELSKAMEKYLSDPSRMDNSPYEFSNGSVSPVLGRKSLNGQGKMFSQVLWIYFYFRGPSITK